MTNELQHHCAALSPGPVADIPILESLLAAAWGELSGDDGGMEGYKLLNRMENVSWEPPYLSFRIERHGGTVLGSTRAEIQHWTVDVEAKTAALVKSGRRQLRPPSKPYPMEAVVAEVIRAIREGKTDDRIRWDGPDKVKLKTGEVFPNGSAFRMTLAARRKAFRSLVAAVLIREGWERRGRDAFVRKSGNRVNS